MKGNSRHGKRDDWGAFAVALIWGYSFEGESERPKIKKASQI